MTMSEPFFCFDRRAHSPCMSCDVVACFAHVNKSTCSPTSQSRFQSVSHVTKSTPLRKNQISTAWKTLNRRVGNHSNGNSPDEVSNDVGTHGLERGPTVGGSRTLGTPWHWAEKSSNGNKTAQENGCEQHGQRAGMTHDVKQTQGVNTAPDAVIVNCDLQSVPVSQHEGLVVQKEWKLPWLQIVEPNKGIDAPSSIT